ncbi:MAG: TIGR04255 family protein [Gemmataceae bacterium]
MNGMNASRKYSRPPIVDAIIDFQVELPADVGLSDLEHCQDAAYPDKKVLTVTADLSSTTTSGQVGFRFTSADEKQIFEARFRGFVLHRLEPYQGWAPFRDEARRLWEIYRGAARPRKVTRVALRYINRLELPLPVEEIKHYLRTCPEVSPDLPQGLTDFSMQLNIPQPNIKSTLLLREWVVRPAEVGVGSVFLDIDLFRTDELPLNEAELWAFFERLRDRKNEIFEACITDRMREVIQ